MTTNTYVIMDDVWEGGVYVDFGTDGQDTSNITPPVEAISPGQRLFQLRKTYGNKLNKPCPIGTWENVYPENKTGWETYAVEAPGQWELWCYEMKIWNCSFSSWMELTGQGSMSLPIPAAKPTRKVRCLNRPGETREIV